MQAPAVLRRVLKSLKGFLLARFEFMNGISAHGWADGQVDRWMGLGLMGGSADSMPEVSEYSMATSDTQSFLQPRREVGALEGKQFLLWFGFGFSTEFSEPVCRRGKES
mmetsp:Transcript_29321/g.49966  ORF Transcript_29321/g.49966 Transcript_29321/m.49966 type:complete len:109 (-) Transcript_29321:3-329(-)